MNRDLSTSMFAQQVTDFRLIEMCRRQKLMFQELGNDISMKALIAGRHIEQVGAEEAVGQKGPTTRQKPPSEWRICH